MGRPTWLAPALAFAAARPWTVLTAACLVLMLPSVLFGVGFTHSFLLNQVWTRQFSELIREGVGYPRWLPHSFEGLGSPAFYFYAPLPYHLCAAVDILSLGRLPTERVIGLAATLLLLASGIAMRAWLRGIAGPGCATLGALAYMAAPYHLLDHYVRGALGEFAAYAALPVVALGIRRSARGQGSGEPLFALGYAALLLSHLPTALLASVTMIPIQVAWCAAATGGARPRAIFLCRCALAGAIGLAISAAYLLPALTAQEFINSERLWTPYHQPQVWLLLTPDRWPNPGLMAAISSFAGAAAIVMGASVRAVLRASPAMGPADRQVLLWACVGLLCLLLMAGAVPQAWTTVPFLAKVQFPWRLLTIVDFSAATAVSVALAGAQHARWVAPFALAVIVAAPGALAAAAHALHGRAGTSPELAAAQARFEAHMPDAVEYLPAGHDFRAGPDKIIKHADLDDALAPLREMPTAVAELMGAAVFVSRAGPHGALRVRVTTEAPTRVVLRRFHFPIWRVTRSPAGEEVPVAPQGPYRLLSFAVPSGSSEYEITAVPLPAERVGWALSVAGALVLAGHGAALSRRRRAAAAGAASQGRGRGPASIGAGVQPGLHRVPHRGTGG